MKNEFYPAYKIGNYHSSFLIFLFFIFSFSILHSPFFILHFLILHLVIVKKKLGTILF